MLPLDQVAPKCPGGRLQTALRPASRAKSRRSHSRRTGRPKIASIGVWTHCQKSERRRMTAPGKKCGQTERRLLPLSPEKHSHAAGGRRDAKTGWRKRKTGASKLHRRLTMIISAVLAAKNTVMGRNRRSRCITTKHSRKPRKIATTAGSGIRIMPHI